MQHPWTEFVCVVNIVIFISLFLYMKFRDILEVHISDSKKGILNLIVLYGFMLKSDYEIKIL